MEKFNLNKGIKLNKKGFLLYGIYNISLLVLFVSVLRTIYLNHIKELPKILEYHRILEEHLGRKIIIPGSSPSTLFSVFPFVAVLFFIWIFVFIYPHKKFYPKSFYY